MYLSKSILIKCLVVSCIILLSQGKSVKKGKKERKSCKNIDANSVQCQPRSQVVPIPRLDTDVPNAVKLNICSGSCGNMQPCVAKRSRPRHFNVTNKHMGKQLRQVDEHLECECCGLTADYCKSRGKKFDQENCRCVCKDEVEKKDCLAGEGIWNEYNCTCKECKKKECKNKKWSRVKCECIDDPKSSIDEYNNTIYEY